MNQLEGNIATIKSSENLSEVGVMLSNGTVFNIFLVETPETASYLQLNQKVKLLFKETEVILTSNFNVEISIQNKIKGKIISIRKGQILSEIILQTEVGNIKSLISTTMLNKLDFKESHDIFVLIKASEIMLST